MDIVDKQTWQLPERDPAILRNYEIFGNAKVHRLLRELIGKCKLVTLYSGMDPKLAILGGILELTPEYLDVGFIMDNEHHIEDTQWQVVAVHEQVKIQFELQVNEQYNIGELRKMRGCLPSSAFRIQRRGAFRVRPLAVRAPMLVVRQAPGTEQCHKIIDLSATGVAIELTNNTSGMSVGDVFEHARLELGPQVPIPCTVIVRSIRPADGAGRESGAQVLRVGAEFINLPGAIERAIQTYVHEAERTAIRLAR